MNLLAATFFTDQYARQDEPPCEELEGYSDQSDDQSRSTAMHESDLGKYGMDW